MTWIWMLAGALVIVAGVYYLVLRPAGRKDAGAPDHATMELRAEQLTLRKTRVPLADVTIHKELVRELKTVTVPATREELVVEKDGVEAARIPLREEQVDVSTRSVPLGEVSVHRRQWEENREIKAVLKKEVARVETTGNADHRE